MQNISREEAHSRSIQIRGDLERIMLAISNLNGINESPNLTDFIEKCVPGGAEVISTEFAVSCGDFPVATVLPLYEFI